MNTPMTPAEKLRNPQTHETASADGSAVKLTWFEDGAVAVVHIIRPNRKRFETFQISREEAKALRAFLPADRPDNPMAISHNPATVETHA